MTTTKIHENPKFLTFLREASAINFLAEKERQRLAKQADRRMAKIIDQAKREGWEG